MACEKGSAEAVLSGAASQCRGRAQGRPASRYANFWLHRVVRNNGTLEELAFYKRSSEALKPGRFLTAEQLCTAQVPPCSFLSLYSLFAICFHRCKSRRVPSLRVVRPRSWGLSSGSFREQTAVKEIPHDWQHAPAGNPTLSTNPCCYFRLQMGSTGITGIT